jgi:carboxy-terminal domain RNA polymerase II polypeptide A small phosphatase
MQDKCDKLVILDLDETLIHATKNVLDTPYDFTFDKYFVYERPLVRQFLNNVSEHFSVGVWSAGGDEYVNEIVQAIKPESVHFEIVWGRSKCSLRRDEYGDYDYEKRLDKLKKKGFGLERILIVDDTPSKSRTNYGNAIYIKEFTGDKNNRELQFLYEYLLTLKTVENVRTIEKRGWSKQ